VPDDLDAAFAAYVAARCTPEEVAHINTADLRLAFLCSRDDAAAIEALYRDQLADMAAVVARQYRSAPLADEVRQRVAEQLLVAPPGAPRGIEQYRGRGSLRAWLRVIGMREAAKLGARELASDDVMLFDRVVGGPDCELLRAKASYRQLFKDGFAAAVAALSFHDRLLLKQHFCDELSLDDMAKLHGMHRATAARQLAKVRDQLLAGTRAHLEAELRLERGEFEQLLALIASQLEASIGRLLR